jgi:hypothetical protein
MKSRIENRQLYLLIFERELLRKSVESEVFREITERAPVNPML